MAKRKRNSDSPEQGPAFFKRAKSGTDHLPTALADAVRRFRGKQKAPTKKMISLRVDQDTVAAYQRTGRGWQSRMNATLVRGAKRLRAS
ncbi:MAG: BrnA antitoxin family protein [Cyanobacteria bacterium]|nr:BrnA antitoxin family protein [Cyanobacteriota bacterium]